ncbi:MAG: hypothetical protein KKH11_06195 [Candidatus Omnitrophica bacterium]|nr:hypothetical protein [Candidatus Omnitrophota bacterium]
MLELRIKNNKRIYQELTQALSPYRERPAGSIMFIVEGTKKKPIIGIRYPGKKLQRRKLKFERTNSALWANLYDFEVVPYEKGKELNTQKFTFAEMMKDFQENKKDNKKFWEIIEELYNDNTITKKPPNLPGIDSKLYLLVLKWIWIQEDFNYRFNWEEVKSPIRYVLETRTGSRTARGAGRAKFFAALILLKHYFNFELVKKIIPLY